MSILIKSADNGYIAYRDCEEWLVAKSLKELSELIEGYTPSTVDLEMDTNLMGQAKYEALHGRKINAIKLLRQAVKGANLTLRMAKDLVESWAN